MNGNEMCEGICCGCTACQSICPKGAINIVEDQKGFLQPIINEDLCVDCNLCKKTCNEYIKKNEITDVFLIKLKDNIQHTISQSGGAFTAISDVIMDRNGTVFGVVMDDNLEAKYSKARNSHERDLMRGSKYMQARVENAYKEVQESLKEGPVLFTGTPCQVGGLLKYLSTKHIDTTNLFTVDLICHGAPSVRVWREMMKYISHDVGKIKYAICRDKIQTGWGGSVSTFYGSKKISSNTFCRIFFTDLCLRDSCYSCQYATRDRVSDVTIGDAWGCKEKNPEFYDPMGVSLTCINTEKGKWLFDKFKNEVEFLEVSLEDYAQKNMSQPSIPHRSVQEFWRDFDSKPFSFIKKKYGENNVILNYKYVIKKGMKLLCKRK